MNEQRLAGVLAGAFLLSAGYALQSALSLLMATSVTEPSSPNWTAAAIPLTSCALAAFLGIAYWNYRGARWLEIVTFVILVIRILSNLTTGMVPLLAQNSQMKESVRAWLAARFLTDLVFSLLLLWCVAKLRQLHRANATVPDPITPPPL